MVLQYLADLKPDSALAQRPGTHERLRLQEWLNFVATEIHKGFEPLWSIDDLTQVPAARERFVDSFIRDLGMKFDVIVQKMGTRPFLMPSGYTVADAYLFTILNWAGMLKVDLSRWPALEKFMERVRARPAVLRALKAEHL